MSELVKSLFVIVTSFLAGFMGGQIGGGGILTLPILLFIGLNPLIAMGTNRFMGIFLNLSSALHFYRHKKLTNRNYLVLGLVALAGSALGTLVLFTLKIDEILLKKIIIAVLFVVAITMLFKKNMGLKDSDFHFTKKNYLLLMVAIFIVSFYGGMFGVAMTTLFAMVFLLKKQSYIQSMSYALFLGTVVSIISSMIFIAHNSVDYYYAFLQAISGSIGAIYGSKFALKKGNMWLKYFTLLIVIVLLIKLSWEVYG